MILFGSLHLSFEDKISHADPMTTTKSSSQNVRIHTSEKYRGSDKSDCKVVFQPTILNKGYSRKKNYDKSYQRCSSYRLPSSVMVVR